MNIHTDWFKIATSIVTQAKEHQLEYLENIIRGKRDADQEIEMEQADSLKHSACPVTKNHSVKNGVTHQERQVLNG